MAILAMAPAGALFDACENGLEIFMLAHGPTDTLAQLALRATFAKFTGVFIGLVLSFAAAAGLLMTAKKKDDKGEGA